ncbi:response regulator transcription factor [Antarcticibacterium flavum]|uniref:Response regulator transcription factor n=1 Tax=Antarcticibacterium flavum TaxID=2058175 RepID=A0A5B7WYR5_9FLAO|nr:LytTR family DNA-binding domain-containing protein [Antarcticibacterium flavum]MCM4161168.1 DNA-binding response regulator [Antarcticibacterium sp. W02-3]QCY68326.1 response regulator transcription factor [Antarcticibacterium flavum]
MEETLLKCAVVDDSSLQRLSIVKLIKDHPNLKLVAEYNNAIETKNGLLDTEVDLIFLDIEMPILTGFELLDDLPNKPQIIFVTGKTKYAFKAFDYDAVDYIHKPVSKERFNNAVSKAINLHNLKTHGTPLEDENFIFVKSNLKNRKVFLNKLKYIEALGDYVKFVTEKDTFVVLATMKSFEEQLPRDQFLRIHKSYIVNLEKVERYNSKNIEIDKQQIPLSRHKKSNLIDALSAMQ